MQVRWCEQKNAASAYAMSRSIQYVRPFTANNQTQLIKVVPVQGRGLVKRLPKNAKGRARLDVFVRQAARVD